MKTSNKIIIGILLICFGAMAAAQLSLHKKFVDNDYITPQAYENIYYSQYKPQGIKHVCIQNIAACQIFTANSVKLAFENGIVQYATYTVVGDTLRIMGVYNQASPGTTRLFRSSQDVRLYLPEGISVQAVNSNVTVAGITKQSAAGNYSFDLDNSSINTRTYLYKDSVNRYFDTLNVTAHNYSGIYFYLLDHVNTLNITLDTASMNDYNAQIAHINLVAKRKATIVLNGDNLKNLNSTVIK